MNKPINLKSKFNNFSELWSPKVIAEMNDYQFKLVKIKGEFVRHSHTETDEVFIVIEGKMSIEFENETIEIIAGEMIIVPKGIMHRPFADHECKLMLIEPKGVINTGDTGGRMTALNDQWI